MKYHKVVTIDGAYIWTACGIKMKTDNIRFPGKSAIEEAYKGDGICRRCRRSTIPEIQFAESQRRNA